MVDVTKRPKRGPPSSYSPKVGEAILTLVMDGASLNEACSQYGVARRTCRGWLEKRDDFAAAYRAATVVRAESLFERFLARCAELPALVAAAEERGLSATAAASALRTQLDMERWALAKLDPRFGDRAAVELTGAAGVPSIPAEQTDPGKIALGVMAVLSAAKKAERGPVTIDATDVLPEPEPEPEPEPARRTVLTAEPPPPIFTGVDPLWARRDRPLDMPAAAWAGRVEPTAGGAAQATDAAMAREEARVADRRAGRAPDPLPSRVITFRRGG